MSTQNQIKTDASTSPAQSDALELALITTLPLGWKKPTDLTARYTNLLVLNGIEALETPPPGPDDTDNWFMRLDAKADLALAHAVLAQSERPPLKPTPIELYANHLRWHGQEINGPIEVWIHIHPLAPALVLEAIATDNHANFINIDAETSEALERLIFRHHRRHIRAQKKD